MFLRRMHRLLNCTESWLGTPQLPASLHTMLMIMMMFLTIRMMIMMIMIMMVIVIQVMTPQLLNLKWCISGKAIPTMARAMSETTTEFKASEKTAPIAASAALSPWRAGETRHNNSTASSVKLLNSMLSWPCFRVWQEKLLKYDISTWGVRPKYFFTAPKLWYADLHTLQQPDPWCDVMQWIDRTLLHQQLAVWGCPAKAPTDNS